MQKLTHDALVASLQEAGIQQGDILHVQSDLLRIGPVECKPTREGTLQFYLSAFQEVLGENGTLTVLTGFEDYGRYGTPFVLEESPSLVDAFSEYVRTRPGAVRSIHPIVSVTGLGALADEICNGPHRSGYGIDSPWGRLHQRNAKIMTFGLGPEYGGTTIFHYFEDLYCVPYKYTKLYTAPVYSGEEEIPGPFTLSVRYLDFGIQHNPSRIKTHMVETGRARSVKTGRGNSWISTCDEIYECMLECFREDLYCYLEKPPNFRPGEIPTDGNTGPLRLVVDRGEQ